MLVFGFIASNVLLLMFFVFFFLGSFYSVFIFKIMAVASLGISALLAAVIFIEL